MISCLFFCPLAIPGMCGDWELSPLDKTAYEAALSLDYPKVNQLIPNPRSVHQHYIVALSEGLELLFTEDQSLIDLYEKRFEKRLGFGQSGYEAETLFLKAESRLLWAFIYLKSGHEWEAAWNLRHAYLLVQEGRKQFPQFMPLLKTSGILEIMLGSVPEKFTWMLGLFGMSGSVEKGLQELSALAQKEQPFQWEALLMQALFKGFVLQQTDVAVKEINEVIAQTPQQPLALFLGASLMIKNSQSEAALYLLNQLEANDRGLVSVPYSLYLKGEILLHKANYPEAVEAYHGFLEQYPGRNFIKDAYYKTGICYWLNGNRPLAQASFNRAQHSGAERAEADKNASRNMENNLFPNVPLSKARYYMDGGYYQEALAQLASIVPKDIPTPYHKMEYYYRKGRLAHKMGNWVSARLFYGQTIEMQGDNPWYFAPNSCLQLGYLSLAQEDTTTARKYFTQALQYKKHEYKNSIDSKAKAALAQLRTRK